MSRKIARRITPDYLHNAALWYLERYAASAGRLRRVLGDKIRRSCRDHPDQDLDALLALVEPEIERLERVSLLNDAALVDQLVSGYRSRGMPARMIIQKLRLKNFGPDAIARALSSDGEDSSDGSSPRATERDAADRYLQRRRLWPYLKEDLDDPREKTRAKQKAWAALARMGYDTDVIGDLIR